MSVYSDFIEENVTIDRQEHAESPESLFFVQFSIK